MLVFRAVPINGQQLESGDSSALADTISSIINIGETSSQAHCPAVINPAVKLPAMTLQLSTTRHCWHTASYLDPLNCCPEHSLPQEQDADHLQPAPASAPKRPTLPAADPAAVQAMATNSTLPTAAAGRHLLQQSSSAASGASDIAVMVDLPPGVSVANAISLLQQASGTGQGTLQQQALAK